MTIREVAARAGVSAQSVSNVLNGRTRQMREETRQRILQSIRELNYEPNAQARGLRLQRTDTIAYLTIDPATRFVADPFTVAILSGMADTLRQHDFSLFVQGLQPGQAGDAFQRLAHQRRFDGAVVHLSGPHKRREQYVKQLEDSKYPFVLIEESVAAPSAACVLADNRRGAAEAVAFLRAQGHKCIGFLTTHRSWPAFDERLRGYEDAVKECASPSPTVWKIERECTETARVAMASVLQQERSVTAVLCANDVLAVGVLQAAKNLKRAVPEQFAVVGFDDFMFSAYVDPPLTTVALPGYDMGCRAVDLVLQYLKEGAFATPKVVFPANLIRRGSA